MYNWKAISLVFAFCLAGTGAGRACDVEITQPFMFVSLWDKDAGATLDSRNEFPCAKTGNSAVCLQKAFDTTTRVLTAYATPSDKRPMGAIVMRYVPGKGVDISYRTLRAGEYDVMAPFRLDLQDDD